MYQGYFSQCRGVAHNSTFPDFPQSVQLFLFIFQYFAPMGHHSIPILAQYGAITIPYICCFVRGNYHPVLFQWGINPSHSWLLFIAHYISHYQGVYKFTRGTFPSRFSILCFLWTHGTLFLPIVNFAALIYPTFVTHGHLHIFFDCPLILLVHFLKYVHILPISVPFLCIYTNSTYLH